MANPFALTARVMDGPIRQPARRSSTFFRGADMSRTSADWLPWTYSPDYEIRVNHRLLRGRARELVRNNPWITGFVDELANNVIGPDGIMLQAKVKTAAGELATKTNKEIERGWKKWGKPATASADGRASWIEIQRLAVQTVATDGEVFLRRLRGFDNEFRYAVQFVDADLVDELYNVPAGNQRNEIRMGVEIDRWNRPVAYWIWSCYAEDMTGLPRVRERIPADEILHLFVQYRANQTRGISWFAPILTSVHHLDGYETAELQAARVSAAKMGFILNKHPDAIANYDPPEEGDNPKTMDVESGLISELFPGQEFVDFDPQHPSTAYAEFTNSVLRAIARGLKVSHLTLTGDLRGANYSSMRAGLLPERDRWRGLQVWLSVHGCEVVYTDWLEMTLLAGVLALDSRLASNYDEVVWKGRGWKWVDPKNDLEAAKIEISLGLNSRQRLAGESGRDFEEVVEELAYEEDFAQQEGVDVSGVTSNSTSLKPQNAPTDPAPGQDDASSSDANATLQPRRLRAVTG